MKNSGAMLWALIGLSAGSAGRADEAPGVKVADDIVTYRGRVDGKAVTWFNDGQKYAIAMNMKIAGAEGVKKSLLQTLGKNKDLRGAVLFSPFTPDGAPDVTEVAVGRNVPLTVVQAVLGELSKVPGIKLALSVMDKDDPDASPQRMYVGGLVKSGKKPIPAEKLTALLSPKLTHAELIESIQGDDRPKAPKK